MKDVKITSQNIGSSIVAEKAKINNVTGHIKNSSDDEGELTKIIIEQCKIIQEEKKIITNEDMQKLAKYLAEAIDKLNSEKDTAKKKNIISKMIENIKETIGSTSNVLEAVFKLATLFGI